MTDTKTNRQWLLAAHPNGRPLLDSDFTLSEAPVIAPRDGEVLIKTTHLGFDPAQKGWAENVANYVAPMALGDVMRGTAAGTIIQSKSPNFAAGDLVTGGWGWQEYATLKGEQAPLVLEKQPADRPITAALSVLGLTGVTAYIGLLEIGKPVAGDTVLVSGAAGATGSAVGQIAKIAGCRVIGVAGGADKCKWLTDELGFDGAIDYKTDDLGAKLKEFCPKGIDVFYDNVGGAILNTALARLAMNARVVICGGISRYQTGKMPAGPENYFNLVFMRARMEGFIVLDYAAQFQKVRARLWKWAEEGKLKYKEDLQHGFENVPRTLRRLFEGANFGKQLLEL